MFAPCYNHVIPNGIHWDVDFIFSYNLIIPTGLYWKPQRGW